MVENVPAGIAGASKLWFATKIDVDCATHAVAPRTSAETVRQARADMGSTW